MALATEPSAWWTREWLLNRGLTQKSIDLYMLGYDAQRKAVVIPYLNALGEVRSWRYRNLEGDVKYLSKKGEKTHLFHVKASRKPAVWLCEGEFDSIILDQMGFNSVGIAGVSGFKPEWKYLFAYCERISIVMDGDEAGQTGARRLSGILGPLDAKQRIVKLPFGTDVTDLYLQDKEALRELCRWEG